MWTWPCACDSSPLGSYFHFLFFHYGRHWLPLVPNALGEGPDALGEAFSECNTGEDCPGYLFTGKTSFPRAKNLALGKGFSESCASTRRRIDAVGDQPASFPSFLKKNSSPSATLGEETLFPESRSPGTRGRHPLPREPQPRHSGKTPSSLSAAAHTLGEATLKIFFLFFAFPCEYIYINHKSTVIYHKPHLYITNDQICMKSTIYYKSRVQKYTLFQAHKFNT